MLLFSFSDLSIAQKPQFACAVETTHACLESGIGGCDLIGEPGWPECSNNVVPNLAMTFRSAIFKFQQGNNSIEVLPDQKVCGQIVSCRPEDPDFDGEYVCFPHRVVGDFLVTEIQTAGTDDCFVEFKP